MLGQRQAEQKKNLVCVFHIYKLVKAFMLLNFILIKEIY